MAMAELTLTIQNSTARNQWRTYPTRATARDPYHQLKDSVLSGFIGQTIDQMRKCHGYAKTVDPADPVDQRRLLVHDEVQTAHAMA